MRTPQLTHDPLSLARRGKGMHRCIYSYHQLSLLPCVALAAVSYLSLLPCVALMYR